MHISKYKISVFVLLIIVIGAGCKKWMDINHDPNTKTESTITPDQVLPGALTRSSNSVNLNFVSISNWMGYWCVAADLTQDPEEQTYNIGNSSNTLRFNDFYSNSNEYQLVAEKALQTGQQFYLAAAMIMKAYNFGLLVDCFNNVPYREALQGVNGATNINYLLPHYDDAKFIYEDLITQIDSAIQLVKISDVYKNYRFEDADIMFHGNKVKWIKFANTLKLRLLMHQASRPDRASYIQAEINKILAEGSGFLGSGEDAAVNPGFLQTPAEKVNAYYESFGFSTYDNSLRANPRANIIAMNFLKADQDPRLGYFYRPVEASVPPGAPEPYTQPEPSNYRGGQYGLQVNPDDYPYQGYIYLSAPGGITTGGPVTAASSGIFKGYNMDAWILTSVESLFLQAEAIQRGWISGDAKTAYKDAVRESYRWLNVNNDPAAADIAFADWYASQTANIRVNWDAATDKYKLLMYQKYMALNGIAPLETWTDYRRNGAYPSIPLSVHPSRTSDVIPIRLLYPQSEYNNNTENVKAQGVISAFTSKIWWMP